jgi:hypothetical protein
VSELCHIAPETPEEHGDLRRHSNAHRRCEKSLRRNALVRFSVRQHARRESISKRAPSPTRTSLRLRINRLRAVEHLIMHTPGDIEVPSSMTFRFSGLKRAEDWCASRKLCQTSQSLAIGYGVARRRYHDPRSFVLGSRAVTQELHQSTSRDSDDGFQQEGRASEWLDVGRALRLASVRLQPLGHRSVRMESIVYSQPEHASKPPL